MTLLFFTLLLSLILFFSFETDVIYEYGNLLKLKLPKINEYKSIIKNGGQSQYLTFLRGIYKDKFLVKLITCPICISVPLSVIFTILSLNILWFPIINMGGLFIFLLLKLLIKYSS